MTDGNYLACQQRELTTSLPRRRLDLRTFYDQYQRANLPVIIEGAIDHWPAIGKWSLPYLHEKYPEKQLKLPDGGGLIRLADYIEALSKGSPPAYLRNVKVRSTFPELLADIDSNFVFSRFDMLNSRLLPNDWVRPHQQVELFIGGPGPAITTMHFDEYYLHNFIIGICGEKEFIMIPPEDTERVYPRVDNPKHSAVNPFAPDAALHPEYAGARIIRGVQRPGDAVYVPPGWWHATRILSPSVSIGFSAANASNWRYFIADVKALFDPQHNSLKWRLVRAYLSGLTPLVVAAQVAFNLRHGHERS